MPDTQQPSVCLPSVAIRDGLDAHAPDLGIARRSVVWDKEQPPAEQLRGVTYWVPSFLLSEEETARRALQLMPDLRVVQTQSAGVDAFVGLVHPPIVLCDGRGVHGSSTSEWALTAMLSVLRKFPRFLRSQHEHVWDRTFTEELAGKTVVIIGAGDVGTQLARRVSACDARPVMVARSARDGVHGMSELPELLPRADIVVLIVPKTSETIGMVDGDFLARMADGALLVNAARGPVVVTDALLAELESGRLRAAIDVVDPEPLPPEHPLWDAPNLLLTPHVAGSVAGLNRRVIALLADQLRRFDAGQPMNNVVEGEY